MKSEKIKVGKNQYYVDSEKLNDSELSNIVVFADADLSENIKSSSGKNLEIDKKDIEAILREGIGGAGYAVWGGGGGGYGNPSMGGRVYGRGFGFGQSSSSGGGPNLMYTYSIKPLDPILQQKPTPQTDIKYIHVGTEVKGKVLGKDKEVHGKIISINDDSDGNILNYVVQEFDTASKFKVDPTSCIVITHEERPDDSLMDFVGSVGEEFYPSFKNYLKESRKK